LNWLDIVLLLIFGLSIASGFAKGFAKLLVGLAATILGFLCGLWFYGVAGSFLLPYVSHKGVANFLGFLMIFVGISLLGAIVGKLLSVMLKWVGLSWIDRLLGGVFGLVRGLVFAIAFVLALMAFSPKPPPTSVVRSHIAPYVIGAANACSYMAPNEVREGVRQSYEKVREAWQQMLEKTKGKGAGREI
jgi:membrane protein required for colicin V production